MICKNKTPRREIVQYLESHGVQTRMLFAGNLVRHPCFARLQAKGAGEQAGSMQAGSEEGMAYGAAYRIAGELVNTDRVMRDAFWVGVYPGMTQLQIDAMAELILEALQNIRR